VGAVDTDMLVGLDIEKNDPAGVVRAAFDGIEAGSLEVLADAFSAQVKAALVADPSQFYGQPVPAA